MCASHCGDLGLTWKDRKDYSRHVRVERHSAGRNTMRECVVMEIARTDWSNC